MTNQKRTDGHVVRSLDTTWWMEEEISALSPLEKLVLLYLLGNQQVGYVGVYKVAVTQIACSTGIAVEEVKDILDTLETKEMIARLEGWFYVRNYIRHQWSVMINRAVRALEDNQIPRGLVALWYKDTAKLGWIKFPESAQEPVKIVALPSDDGTDTVALRSDDGTDTVSRPDALKRKRRVT